MSAPRCLLLTAVLLAACSPAVPAATRSATAPVANPPSASPQATPKATLPGGLATRTGRPALVNGEAAACIPDCGRGGATGGMLPAGRYQTEWFFGGYMTLETDGTWERGEDSNGQLGLPIAAPEGIAVYQVAFFLDPALVVDDVIQSDVPREAAAYVAWLAEQPELVVSAPVKAQIGSVPALAVDIRLGPTAKSHYDDCPPDPCVPFLKVAAFDSSDGVLGDDESRYYFADISYSGTEHMLVVKVEGRDPADLDRVLPRIEKLLATVVVPARPRTASG